MYVYDDNNDNDDNNDGIGVKKIPRHASDTIDNPSHKLPVSVLCCFVSPRAVHVRFKMTSCQQNKLAYGFSEPLIETLWLQIGGAAPPQTPPLSFSALPRPRVCEKLGGGFSTLAKVKNRNWQGACSRYVMRGEFNMVKRFRPKGEGGRV